MAGLASAGQAPPQSPPPRAGSFPGIRVSVGQEVALMSEFDGGSLIYLDELS